MKSLDRIRTDVVGSLLRPARWKEARLAFETGKMPAAEFAGVELECVQQHNHPHCAICDLHAHESHRYRV